MNDLITQPQQLQPVAIRQEMTVQDIRKRKELVHELMRDLMVPGQHYGEIPGTDGKPALLKSGAEMLCMTFRLAPTFNTVLRDLQNNHREYRVDCTLTAPDGSVVATGMGSASTMESKHRWRLRSLKCPVCNAEAIRKGRDGFFCGAKLGGCGENFSSTDKRIVTQPKGKVENPDIADQWNTVLKIAAKRAHTHATLLATAASDMFVPEDSDDDDGEVEEPKKQKPAATELSPKEALIRDCVKAFKALGRSRESVAELLIENSVTPPKDTWGELSDEMLTKAKAVLEAELRLGAKPEEKK